MTAGVLPATVGIGQGAVDGVLDVVVGPLEGGCCILCKAGEAVGVAL